MAFDPSGDYTIFDGLRDVVHVSREEGGQQAYKIADALQQLLRIQDADGAWVLLSDQCVWRLPNANVIHDPTPGDQIRDGQINWSILDAAREPLTDLWECKCVRERR